MTVSTFTKLGFWMALKEQFRELKRYSLDGVQVTGQEVGYGSYAAIVELEYRGLKCAGKRLHKALYSAEYGRESIVNKQAEECRLLSRMRHPNVVHFLGMFYERNDPLPMLVMELLSTNLNECIDQYGILPIEISCSILHDVSLGLNYLHNQNLPILHRDLSTKAILLASNMMAKIAGLGMAKAYDPHTLQMTSAPGTVSFMPPETFVDHPKYDMTIDVFSFGVVMIHVFSGEIPVPDLAVRTNPDGTLIAVSEAERREKYLCAIGHDHPLMDLILKCISNHPPQRGNAHEIVQRLKDAVVNFPPLFTDKVEMLRRIKVLEEEAAKIEKVGYRS